MWVCGLESRVCVDILFIEAESTNVHAMLATPKVGLLRLTAHGEVGHLRLAMETFRAGACWRPAAASM